jgi:predicted dehydrogenase
LDKVRVGFVGAGGIANVHLQHVGKNEMAEVTAICDIDEVTVYANMSLQVHHDIPINSHPVVKLGKGAVDMANCT